jgi:hypothetical protein
VKGSALRLGLLYALLCNSWLRASLRRKDWVFLLP